MVAIFLGSHHSLCRFPSPTHTFTSYPHGRQVGVSRNVRGVSRAGQLVAVSTSLEHGRAGRLHIRKQEAIGFPITIFITLHVLISLIRKPLDTVLRVGHLAKGGGDTDWGRRLASTRVYSSCGHWRVA